MVRMYNVWLVGVTVRRYIDILIINITFPTPLVLALFWGSSIPTLFIFKCFFVLLFKTLGIINFPQESPSTLKCGRQLPTNLAQYTQETY